MNGIWWNTFHFIPSNTPLFYPLQLVYMEWNKPFFSSYSNTNISKEGNINFYPISFIWLHNFSSPSILSHSILLFIKYSHIRREASTLISTATYLSRMDNQTWQTRYRCTQHMRKNINDAKLKSSANVHYIARKEEGLHLANDNQNQHKIMSNLYGVVVVI